MIDTAPVAALAVDVDAAGRRDWSIVSTGTWAHELRVPRHLLAFQDPLPSTPSSTVAPSPGPARGDEWQIGAGFAWSIDLLQSEGGRRYVPMTFSWGRDVTRDAGPGLFRGRLMWAVEAMPLYWQSRPATTVGVGVSPLVWRWRFVPRRRAAAFAELAFGGLFTADPVPEGTEAANFLTHAAFGIRWRPAQRIGWVTAYRFQHISNGNQSVANPGVNAHVLWIGVSLSP